MSILFLCIIFFSAFGDVAWWAWADRRLKKLPHAVYWRLLAGAFAAMQLLCFVFVLYQRTHRRDVLLPETLLTAVYLWHLLVMPLWAGWMIVRGIVLGTRAIVRRIRRSPSEPPKTEPIGLSRRDLLRATAVAVPPLLTVGTVATALSRLDSFRVRRIVVPINSLPAPLDGLTIAHISDVHVGKFTDEPLLRAVADVTNNLKTDLVVMTGDLIDFSLSDLGGAIDMLRRIDSRFGVYTCQGNHDMFQSGSEFTRRVKEAGIPLLVNETATVKVKNYPVQFLGMQWGWPGQYYDAYPVHNMDLLAPQLHDETFPILLAHHPHTFDIAADIGLPLTLAGHTHGGQLMLTPNFGVGSWIYRYYSGLYRKADSSLVVSNGVGNWFPLRINAPAEILHLTLRRPAA